jgi:hypothetical protein
MGKFNTNKFLPTLFILFLFEDGSELDATFDRQACKPHQKLRLFHL